MFEGRGLCVWKEVSFKRYVIAVIVYKFMDHNYNGNMCIAFGFYQFPWKLC